jgi:multidrug efflux pump subunit AcrB
MLPFDNKPEFSLVIDMPEGTALGPTQNLAWQIADVMRSIDEVTAVQTYAGTAKPFDFNGMVRHYYLRDRPWQAEVQVQLLDKGQRKRTSHDIATAAREMIAEIAKKSGGTVTVVEMPPGPPVIQTVAAELYAPDNETLRKATAELTEIFREIDGEHTEARIADVRNFMYAPHDVKTFEVSTEKAARRGISVNDVVTTLEMAMGGYIVGDVKQGAGLGPTYITLEIPRQGRAQTSRLGDLPVAGPRGKTVPLAEVGQFVDGLQDQPLFFKDLRSMQYIVGDAVGRLAAPTYGMFAIDQKLAERNAGSDMPIESKWFGAPGDETEVAFEWSGEWTVTFETFRDMGIAFGMALVLIYMLLVAQFGNFLVPAITLAPIPLPLLGLIPGPWFVGLVTTGHSAEFTATSMIGFIALAGIIVRNSILLVDFALHAIADDKVSVRESMILSCRARTRPIIITALALVAGSSVILTDPIFQGMAISLLFGSLVSTLLTLVVIPLGCVSASKTMEESAGVGKEAMA